jgi:hypothetical protein
MTLLHIRNQLIQPLIYVYGDSAGQIMLRIFMGLYSFPFGDGQRLQNPTSWLYITGKSS